ncbi:MAG: imidazole glycerol phosphate synthase subunit HisH, partial [bacterium]|nr:imidazole glycerol phosphate synthase subunit HisH [bacterium]
GRVTRFGAGVRVPQLGWNRVEPTPGCVLSQPGYAYFANSYRLVECPTGWRAAYADHGGRFVAALERGPLLACQFHPELSGSWGIALLGRWLEAGVREAAPC